MELRDLQTALARRLVLGEASAAVNSFEAAELEAFAASLGAKRLKAIRRLLPMSAARMDTEFDRRFRAWIAGHAPDEYRREARAFAAWLATCRELALEIRETARFEAVGWDCVLRGRRRIGLFRARMGTGGSGWTLAVWVRVGDRRAWIREWGGG